MATAYNHEMFPVGFPRLTWLCRCLSRHTIAMAWRLTRRWAGWSLGVGMSLTLLRAQAADPSGDGYLIKNWTTADGLPENTVRTIIQTRDGYLWVGTSGGVARFDGIRFTVFTSGNTPELLSDNIWDMHEDRAGIIWLATSRGLARYQEVGS